MTDPTAARPATSPDRVPSPVVLVVEFTATPGTVDELRERLLGLTRSTRQEEGCLRYDLHADAADPLRLVFVEEWASAQAHAAHDRTAWVADLRGHLPRLLAEDGLRRLDLARLEP